jgi:starch-binding outer membrane protein, SusD/RagB family
MKMSFRNHHISAVAFLGTALCLASCSKSFLQQSPFDSTPASVALGTPGGMQTALQGVYSGLKSTNLWGRSLPMIGDVMSDNAYLNPSNAGYYIPQATYSVTVQDGTISGTWSDAYTEILRCNNIINDTLSPAPDVNEYRGEALAIRALLYFYLANFYASPYTENPNVAGVPLVLTNAPFAEPPRATVNEVFEQIVSDLTSADTLMTTALYTNSAQFSKYAGEGLLSKVYLYMGDSTDAYNTAVDVINNGGFSLVQPGNLVAYWANNSPRTDGVESLLEVEFDKVNSDQFDGLDEQYSTQGYGDFLCAGDLYDSYSPTDVRGQLFVVSGNGDIFVNKYPNAIGTNYSKILRLSDIYLIAAEASAYTNPTQSQIYLNDLMAVRDPSTAYSSTGTQLKVDIINERRKELAFEGDRYFDLNRLQWNVVRTLQFTTPQTILFTDTRRVAPIPQTQTLTDPNCIQNPGY